MARVRARGGRAGRGRPPVTAVTAVTAVTVIPTVEDLVIEDLSGAVAEQYQPGTCICWMSEALAE